MKKAKIAVIIITLALITVSVLNTIKSVSAVSINCTGKRVACIIGQDGGEIYTVYGDKASTNKELIILN